MSQPLYKSRPDAFDIAPARKDRAGPVNDFIHLSEGLSNSYLISTSDGRIVVNTGMGFEGPIRKEIYDSVDPSPTRYIILTQGHVDHVGGVDLFREDGTEIVAHANNLEHQAYDARIQPFRTGRSYFAFAEAIDAAGRDPDMRRLGGASRQSIPTPTRVFEDRDSLRLGDLEIELLWTPGGETRDSLIIWLPQHRICFTGNLFSALFGHIPNLVTIRGDRYRDALEFVASADRVLALEPELLLVGHGGPVQGAALIRSEIERVRDATQYLHDEVVRGMNEQRTVHELMRDIRLPPELEVGEGYGKVSWDVRAIWEHYAGWFHQASTTELYDLPARAVHGDLADLAGGPEPIVTRARARLASGDAVGALHLAEVALAADDSHRGALDLSLDAHRALEAASVNFWETKWLRHRIADLEKRRD